MATQNLPIKNGEIRHVTKNPDVLIKVNALYNIETEDESGNVTNTDLYLPTHEFPKYHYVVILEKIISATEPNAKFYVAKLITHSAGFDNLKVTEDLYDKTSTTINLTNSYVTRDKFLIPETEVQIDKAYGAFDLIKLEKASEY